MKKLNLATINITVLLTVIVLIGAAFYWMQIRPGHIRQDCQALVDQTLKNKLESNGFQMDKQGKWTRQDEYCTLWDCTDTEGSEGYICKNLGGTGRKCLKTEWHTIEPSPDDLEKDTEDANKLYKPCLRRNGL